MKEIILIGDSIRMGYQEVVRRELTDLAEVWAPDANGGTSQNVLSHLEEWVLSRSPSVVHINCGLHDITREFPAVEPAISAAQYEGNVREILRRTREETRSTVIWASTTPVKEKLHHKKKGFDRQEAGVLPYNEISKQIAREFQIPIDDLFSVVIHAGQDKYLADDGVHFTDEGYELLGKAVANFIKPYLEDVQQVHADRTG